MFFVEYSASRLGVLAVGKKREKSTSIFEKDRGEIGELHSNREGLRVRRRKRILTGGRKLAAIGQAGASSSFDVAHHIVCTAPCIQSILSFLVFLCGRLGRNGSSTTSAEGSSVSNARGPVHWKS